LGTYANQPLTPGNYDFYIALKRNENNAELSSIQKINLTTKTKDLIIGCGGFKNIENGIEISNLDSNALRNYAQDPTGNLYVFNCRLKVSEISEEKNVFITSEALYNVNNKYYKDLNPA
jgi:hypothetical protein